MAMTALNSVRVVQIAEDLPAAYCARLLADFGADVVMLERLSTSRHGQDAPKTGFEEADRHQATYVDQNKRSVALDLDSESGRDIWRQLLQRADMIIDAGDPGTLAEHELDELERDNERERPRVKLVTVAELLAALRSESQV